MAKCGFCGEELTTLPFLCNYCSGSYCAKHRLPESHNCALVKETSQGIDLDTSEKEMQEEQVNKKSSLTIREVVGEELFNRMQKYADAEIWESWIRKYVSSRLSEFELDGLGRKYGIERKGDSYEHFLLKTKACEYLNRLHTFVRVETEVKPPSTIGHIHKQGNKYVAEAHGAPAIDVYLTTGDGKRIWVEAETDIKSVEKDIRNSKEYSTDYNEFYIIIPMREYARKPFHPIKASRNGHFLLYDEGSSTVKEIQAV